MLWKQVHHIDSAIVHSIIPFSLCHTLQYILECNRMQNLPKLAQFSAMIPTTLHVQNVRYGSNDDDGQYVTVLQWIWCEFGVFFSFRAVKHIWSHTCWLQIDTMCKTSPPAAYQLRSLIIIIILGFIIMCFGYKTTQNIREHSESRVC